MNVILDDNRNANECSEEADEQLLLVLDEPPFFFFFHCVQQSICFCNLLECIFV